METAAPKDAILFTRGNPDTDALPIDEISRCAADIFKREGRVLFQYGHYSGHAPLRQWIAEHFGAAFEQVLLGNSSKLVQRGRKDPLTEKLAAALFQQQE